MTSTLNPLSSLLAGSADLLDIPTHVRDMVVARYQDVGAFLAANGRDECVIYPQGSFLTGTVIQPPHDAEYDIDLVFRENTSKDNTTQAELKERVGDLLESYYDYKRGTADAPEGFCEKRRCWTLSYSSDGFHLDVLPAVVDADCRRSKNSILLTDTKLRPWQYANPKDYAVWFRTQSEEMQRKIAASARTAHVDDVPNWIVRSTLQRLVQVLKWHCYLDFIDDVDNRPPSVLITTLAAHAYQGQEDLGQAILEVVEDMPNYITEVDGRWHVLNPAQPKENFADKWNEPDTAHRRQAFDRWLRKIGADIETAYATQGLGIDTLVERLSPSFDRRILAKSASNWAQTTIGLRSRGHLGVATGTGSLGIGTGRTSPPHQFYGHAQR